MSMVGVGIFLVGASLVFTVARALSSHFKDKRRAAEGILPPPHALPDASLRGRWLASFWNMEEAPGGHDRCLFSHFCFCLAAGEVAKRTGGSYALDCCCASIGGMYVGYYPLCYGATRFRLREQHGIPGTICEDLCLTTFFPCCYIVQALNHLDRVEGITAAAPRMPEIYACKYSSSMARLTAPLSPLSAIEVGASKGEPAAGAGAGAGAAPSAAPLPAAAPLPIAAAV